MKKLEKITGGIIFFILATILLLLIFSDILNRTPSTPTLVDNSGMEHKASELPPIPVPEGWHEHSLGGNGVLLTRSQTLPDIGATELYAYGEQISISAGMFDGDPNNRESWQYIRWVFEDEALVRNWSWTTVRGLDALRVESEAAGASGGVLYYFIFSGDQLYTLSLYPFDTSEHVAAFEQFVWEYVAAIYAAATI